MHLMTRSVCHANLESAVFNERESPKNLRASLAHRCLASIPHSRDSREFGDGAIGPELVDWSSHAQSAGLG